MAVYKYVAKDYSLNKVTGDIVASSERDARIKLKEQDLFVLQISEVKDKTKGDKGSILNMQLTEKKVKLEELTLFSRQFATLIDSGVPITRSLNILATSTPSVTLSKALKKVTEDIEGGLALSKALGQHPKIFPTMYIDMVAAAEIGGALPEVLNRLAGYLEKDKNTKAKVKSAFTYPSVVMVVAFLAIIAILIFVMPQFETLFSDLDAELPLPTKILLGSSDFMIKYWYYVIGFIVASVIGIKLYGKTATGKKNLDYVKLNLPVIGVVVKKSTIARFARTLETLQRSGVPLVESLTIVARASANYYIERDLMKTLDSLEKGEGISKPLEKSKYFPSLVVQMVQIGEETGELEQLLSKVADFYEEEVDIAVKNLTAMLEPIITVFLGVVVGFVALAVITPMYEMLTVMQQGM